MTHLTNIHAVNGMLWALSSRQAVVHLLSQVLTLQLLVPLYTFPSELTSEGLKKKKPDTSVGQICSDTTNFHPSSFFGQLLPECPKAASFLHAFPSTVALVPAFMCYPCFAHGDIFFRMQKPHSVFLEYAQLPSEGGGCLSIEITNI